MGRWEPDAAGRLRAAAMELYLDPGFEQTTVADIATRAGVTARTFFRYFADKREVLFAGSDELQRHLLATVAAATDAPAMTLVATALETVGDLLTDREFSRRRQAVIAANSELRERELVKLAAWAGGLADALRARDVPEPGASIAAETGVAVFRVAFEQWVEPGERRTLAEVLRDSFAALKTLS